MHLLRKRFLLQNIPESLSWLQHLSVSYKLSSNFQAWQTSLIPPKPNEILLYSPSKLRENNILIIPSCFECLDIKKLIKYCRVSDLSPWVLIPKGFCLSMSEYEEALKNIDFTTIVLAMGPEYNFIQETKKKILVYNPVFFPQKLYLSMPTWQDQEMIIKVNKNLKYLKNEQLSLENVISKGIFEILPKDLPNIVSRKENVIMYSQNGWNKEGVNVMEPRSILKINREWSIVRILKSLVL
ncbi:hypothetical protein SteCoe_5188 [Stentor coeruleus]|uniref:Uncharacterized protein n=1 Tax=Stentor coeruleus TaxID=5963 RepID=A0A1R2CT01_9CILI|nr:hypothetical protein SteCoe_5188 [Stentor coeruleus]